MSTAGLHKLAKPKQSLCLVKRVHIKGRQKHTNVKISLEKRCPKSQVEPVHILITLTKWNSVFQMSTTNRKFVYFYLKLYQSRRSAPELCFFLCMNIPSSQPRTCVFILSTVTTPCITGSNTRFLWSIFHQYPCLERERECYKYCMQFFSLREANKWLISLYARCLTELQ